MTEDNRGSGNLTGLLVGALLGAAVGAGVALLLAPRSGKETRKWLARNTRDISDRATRALERAKRTVRRESTVVAGQAAEAVADLQEMIR